MGNALATGSATGRVVVITGGASGIGLATAYRCMELGMKVVIADISADNLAMASAELLAAHPGGVVVGHVTDVSSEESVQVLHDRVYSDPTLGEVGFLFNNAGLSRDESFSAYKTPLDLWRATFDVNLFGVLHMLKHFIPSMLEQDTECVVCNTSSYAGLINSASQGFAGGVSYVSSKHALTTLTESLAHEMRTMKPHPAKIQVHGLFPAMVATGFFANALEAASDEQKDKLSTNRIFTNEDGLQPSEIADLLFDGIASDTFYIRAFDNGSDKELLGKLIMERAKDIAQQRPPISHQHPDRDIRWQTTQALREPATAEAKL